MYARQEATRDFLCFLAVGIYNSVHMAERKRGEEGVHEQMLLVAGDEEGAGSVEAVDMRTAEAIVEFGTDEELAALTDNLDATVDCRRLLEKAKERDSYLYNRLLTTMIASPERYPLNEDLALRLVAAGHSEIVALRVAEIPQPSVEVADALVATGQGWTVLAKRDRFQGWTIDERVIDNFVITNTLAEETAEGFRAALGSPERTDAFINDERLASLHAFLQAEEACRTSVDHDDEYVATVLARDRFANEAAPDVALLRSYEKRHGTAAMQRVMYALDRHRPSWLRSKEWQETIQSAFVMADEQFFDKHFLQQLNGVYAPLTDEEQVIGSNANDRRLQQRWVAERVLEANTGGVERKLDNILALCHGNEDDRWKANKMFQDVGFALAVAGRSRAKDAYVPSATRILADERMCFAHPKDEKVVSDLRAADIFADFAREVARVHPDVITSAYCRFLEHGKSLATYRQMLSVVLETFHGEENDALLARTILATEKLDDPIVARRMVQGILVTSRNAAYRERSIAELVREGIVVDDALLATWKRCAHDSPGDRALAAEKNITTMLAVENERRGAVRTLRSEFGIENFSRYTKEMLVDQYDNRDDVRKPYGIVISPKSDYNGAFARYSFSEDAYDALYKQVCDKYHMRIFEAGSRFGVARALVAAQKRYTDHGVGKIAFGVVGGHGTRETIQFGDDADGARLRIDDLQGHGASRSGAFFEPGATIVLRSCSTGKEGGIAQKISEVMGLRVIGPDIPTNAEKIEVRFDEKGKPILDVVYNKGSSMAYAAGKKKA